MMVEQRCWPLKIGLAVLAGLFLSDWHGTGVESALRSLPLRFGVVLVIVLGWVSFAAWRDRRKRSFR
jgi:uncharacterized membrane protein YbjE (DUF340 family)